jgi:hypothetical protein
MSLLCCAAQGVFVAEAHTIRHRLPASSGAVNEWQSQARFRARMRKYR